MTHLSPAGRRSRNGVTGLLIAGAICAGVAAPPASAASEQDARAAASRGAQWLVGNLLQSDGSGLGGFGLTGLAAGGIHPADAVASGGSASAADNTLAAWRANGPGTRANDVARSLLSAHAAGIDPARISATENFVARAATFWDGSRVFDPIQAQASLISDDIFTTLGLAAAGAPRVWLEAISGRIRAAQTADGGWNFPEAASSGSVDMTGAAIAALCASGSPAADPDVREGLAFLKGRQSTTTAGWANTDSAGWAVSGLRACGIDPEGTQWRESARSPLDYLIAQQLPSGAFRFLETDTTDNALATLDAARPLGGFAFTAEPPARPGGAPRLLPVPVVAPGTTVPVTLVIDYGAAVPIGSPGRVKTCRVQIASETPLSALLSAGRTASTPLACVVQHSSTNGRLASLNGIGEDSARGRGWTLSIDGGPAGPSLARPVPFGSTVLVRYGASLAGTAPRPSADPPHTSYPRPTAKAALRITSLRVRRLGRRRVLMIAGTTQGGTRGAKVRVAVARLRGSRCQPLLKNGRLGRPRSCRTPASSRTAAGVRRWQTRLALSPAATRRPARLRANARLVSGQRTLAQATRTLRRR